MLSITTISIGQAASYYRRDSYYTSDQGKGQWGGRGAELLGLDGEVKREEFENLIKGYSTDGKTQLVGDSKNGEKHVAGIDCTFSADKSTSLLGIHDSRIAGAHRKAFATAFSEVEKYAAGRRYNSETGKVERFKTGNIVAATYEHSTSRELDPSLHTHCFIANMTQLPNGEWRALDRGDFYKQKLYLGQVYRNELAAELRKLGYAITFDEKGLFEIAGVDKELIAAFSRRSEQIKARKEELRAQFPHANESKLNEMACLDSRKVKKNVDLAAIRESWQERIRALGYCREGILTATREAFERSQERENNLSPTDYLRLAANAIHENESTFSREDIFKNALRLSVGECTHSQIEKAFEERIGAEYLKIGHNHYSTLGMVHIEHRILAEVLEGQNSLKAIYSPEQLQKELAAYPHLTTGQRSAVELIATTKDRVVGVQGDAGTGKTTVLKTVNELAEREGFTVRGLAFTGKAANEIEQASGIKSATLHSFIGTLENGDKAVREIEKDGLWVVDEASLTGSRQLLKVIESAQKYGARVVLIGDVKQLVAVTAGRMFKELQTHGMATVRMAETLRQTDETYRAIIEAVAEKRIDDAFDLMREHGKLAVADKGELIEGLCADYCRKDTDKTIIVTDSNRNRREINGRIRKQLKDEGRLAGGREFSTLEPKNLSGTDRHFANAYDVGDVLVFTKGGAGTKAGATATVAELDIHHHTLQYEIEKADGTTQTRTLNLTEHGNKVSVFTPHHVEFCEGEKVLFAKNDKLLGVQNGLAGTVEKIDGDQLSVRLPSGDMKEFSINEYRYLAHGYAITDYKAQGQTADVVLVHAPSCGMEKSFNSFYVGATRGRQDFMVYTDDATRLSQEVRHEQEKTSTITDESAEQVKSANDESTDSRHSDGDAKDVSMERELSL